MKSKAIILIAAMLIFGVGFAVYAYNSTSTTSETITASCCCSGDSCPMKTAAATTTATAAGSHECCCKGDGASCPMKTKGEKAAGGEHSCPMMSEGKHEGHKMAAGANHEMKSDGEAQKTMDHGKMDGQTGCSCPCCAAGIAKKDKTAI